MDYNLTVVVSLSIFFILDIIVCFNSRKNMIDTDLQKGFFLFAVAVSVQQFFAVLTQLTDPIFNISSSFFTYIAYGGALIFMTLSSYLCYIYLRRIIFGERKRATIREILLVAPVFIITITALLSPWTHWLFYADEAGAYQRGSLFLLQMICPYIYIITSTVLAIARRKKDESDKTKKMLRLFLLFTIPSLVGVVIQMAIVKGAYSATGVSIGLLLMYLEIYVDLIGENRRLKSIEPLMQELQQKSKQQEEHIEEIAELNAKLQERMSVIQSMSRVYFVSFYANVANDSFVEISNTDFVRKYVGEKGTASEALKVFCNMMVDNKYTKELLEFVDLSTLSERMRDKQFITCDYLGNVAGWCQAYFIAGDRDENGNLLTVFLAARTIHDEKEREFAQQRELVNARNAAEAASDAKTAFLNNMSHDIRTPLNAILGFSDLMAKEKNNPEVVGDYLKKIKTSGEYLLSIVNNVLDMAKIESGKVAVNSSFVDLEVEIANIKSYIGMMVESSNHKFNMDVKIFHRYVLIDFAKHQQILVNLISNAVKYTPEGGEITFKFIQIPYAKAGYGTYRMIISDTGIGMTPEFLEHLFDSFSRERDTTNSKIIGTGLGMSIVKKLVDLMDGTIEVQSEKGKGSTFIITWNLELVNDPEQYKQTLLDQEDRAVDFNGKRILLTEDNELNAEIATEILEDAGFVVEQAENGVVCIEKLTAATKGYYDLILMDIQMPLLNGYDATRRIREMGLQLPIIAMTANAFEEDKKNALAAGMNGHLSKPIDIPKLMDMLSKVLQ